MSNLPRVDLEVQDGGLGVSQPLSGKSVAVIGVSSGGTLDELTVGTFSNKQKMLDARGYGPATEAACNYIDRGALVVFCGVDATTQGTVSAVTPGAGNQGASVMTITGNPHDAYDIEVTVTREGTAGSDPEPGFTFSLDGGRTTSDEIRVPSNRQYLMPNTGLTLNFTAATMKVDDTYSASCTEPLAAAQDVSDAVDALAASTKKWRFLHVVGPCDESLASSIATKFDTMEEANRYVRCLVEVRPFAVGESHDTWQDDVIDDFNTFVSSRVAVAAGHCRFPSAVSGRLLAKSIAFPVGARAMDVEVHVDLGRIKDGPLRGVDSESLTHDERVTETMDSERFLTLRTFTDDDIGAFVTNPRLMSAAGSDFKYLQHGFVMDKACASAYRTLKREVNDDTRVEPNEALGYSIILEQDRQAIEQAVEDDLRNEVISPGNASFAQCHVAADDDILSTETVNAEIEIIPVGYKKRVRAKIGFRKTLSS